MKAAVINKFGTPDVFEIKDMPKPLMEKDDDVLIKVMASSVNPVDWKIRKGNLKMILGSKFPIILGFDASGIVEETGSAVTKFKKGDAVYSRVDRKFGRTYAEYAVGSESTFALKPESLSHNEAAAVPLAALTSLQALRDKGAIKSGDKVLINGAAGGVGYYAVQLAKVFNAECTAVSSYRHEKMMTLLSPDLYIDYTKEDFKRSDKRYDILFDVVGTESFLSCKHLLKPGGTYITSLPRLKLLVHFVLSLFTGKKVRTVLMKPKGADLEFVNTLVSENKLKVVIDKVFPLDEIEEAHKYSESGRAEGKIVISVN